VPEPRAAAPQDGGELARLGGDDAGVRALLLHWGACHARVRWSACVQDAEIFDARLAEASVCISFARRPRLTAHLRGSFLHAPCPFRLYAAIMHAHVRVWQGDDAPVLYAWVARVGTGLMHAYIGLAGELSLYAPHEMPYVYWCDESGSARKLRTNECCVNVVSIC
jgi:hypothetical protein